MKRFIAIMALAFAAKFAFAQSAEASVDKLIDYISKNKIFEIAFTCDIANEDAGLTDKLEGVLFMDTACFRLQAANLIIIDNGIETLNYNGDINEVTMFTNEDDEDIINPFSLIFNYKEHFNVSVTSTFQSIITLNFVPKEEELLISMQLTLNSKTNHISSLTIIDNNNTEYDYTITKFIPNAKKDRSIFELKVDDFPNATVIDLRD